MPDQSELAVEDAFRREGLVTDEPEVDDGPSYRMLGSSKIPVSKSLGKVWCSRKDQAVSSRQDIEECWTEAIRYYENDQMSHRESREGKSGNRKYARYIGENWSATENVVFANIATMLPMLYAKNPNVEITATNVAVNEKLGQCAEALLDRLFTMSVSPGINLKPYARRGVFYALLTNCVYSRVGYTEKKDGSEQVLEDLRKLSDEYQKAKTPKQIKDIEGKLKALEEKASLLSPSGPKFDIVSPYRIFIDPSSRKADHSDANWIMEYDFLPTTYLNAVYRKEVDGKLTSLYEPTHIVRVGQTANVDDEVNTFSLFNKDDSQEARGYGYKDKVSFDLASYTKVWYVWDKTTRRMLMYADNDWCWPIWVWDDPLGLLEFFPYDQLHFHESFEGSQSKGEVTYYLDQQDTINDNLSTINQARRWVKYNIVYDTNVLKQNDVEKILRGDTETAVGIDLQEGKKIEDHIKSIAPPAMQYPELLDNKSSFEAINRISGVNEAQRGGQFKTNTTNQAIDFYKTNVDIRVDERIDLIEDWIGKFSWKLLQLLFRHMSQQEVIKIVGQELGVHWKQITDPEELRVTLHLRVVGGSTDKPTSKVKKEHALQIGQILGQFASGIPVIGVLVLKMFERAFDEVVITPEDWAMISQAIASQQAQEQPQPGLQGEGQPPQSQGQGADVVELIKQLPPEAQQELAQLVESGVPPTEALKQVAQKLTQAPTQA